MGRYILEHAKCRVVGRTAPASGLYCISKLWKVAAQRVAEGEADLSLESWHQSLQELKAAASNDAADGPSIVQRDLPPLLNDRSSLILVFDELDEHVCRNPSSPPEPVRDRFEHY